MNHRVTEVRWFGIDNYDRSDSASINESGNESDDSGKTVINISEDKKPTSNTLLLPNATDITNESGVEILCEDGTKFRARSAICTLPLGVLKEKLSKLFVPPLPNYKVESIDRLLFGTVDKIFLGYDRPFLNADVSEVLLLWENDCDKPKTENGECIKQKVKKTKTFSKYTYLPTCFFMMLVLSVDLTNSWYKKIYSFSKVSETLLLGWVSGKEALYMETLPDEIISETCTKVLRKFLNDPFVPLPKFIYW